MHNKYLLLLLPLLAASFKPAEKNPPAKPVVIAYVGGFRGTALDPAAIAAEKITHINYAFVDIKHGQAWLTNERTDTTNFRLLNTLKLRNPELKILISIGGWSWSENFSDAVLTPESRAVFAHTSVEIARKHQLDGVDIDWEYPATPGEEGNIYRPEDKQNYTLMFEALRASLDTLEKETGKKYLLTTAVGNGQYYIDHTEMDKVHPLLDYVNIMTYDFRTNPTGIAGHHTNLYASTNEPREQSADRSVKAYLAVGVPPEKIVMGIAFYGRGWVVKDATNKGLDQQAVKGARAGGFTQIKDSLMTQGYKSHWDKRAKAPYLFHPAEHIFISYDDERSTRLKCQYVQQHKLAGVMFWEYSSDPKGYLLNAIHDTFN